MVTTLSNTLSNSHSHAFSDSKNWRASLVLGFRATAERTVLDRSHQGPMMVQRPFYPEGEVCHAYMLHPPGGIVGGDSLAINASCSVSANALVTTPGATKFYGSDGRLARQHQQVVVTDGSVEWFPQENIFFNACEAEQTLSVDLVGNSRFIGWEINCFGRPAGNHQFISGGITLRLKINRDGTPLLHERLRLTGQADIAQRTGLNGAVVCGTLLFFNGAKNSLEILAAVRDAIQGFQGFAATVVDELVVLRYLGNSAEQSRSGFIAAWCAARPIVMNRAACLPRIWAT